VADPIRLPVPVDPGEFKDQQVEVVREVYPDWDPDRAGLASQQLEAAAQIGAQISETAQDVATDIELYMGQNLDALPPVIATAATITATWTAQDSNGYLLPAGSVAGIDVGGGQLATFQTIADYTLAAGSSSLASVSMTATVAGAGGNGLTGAGQIVDAPSEWTAVTFTDTSGGGDDGETVDEYQTRYARARRLRAPRPITADDYPEFLRDSITDVDRAAVLNGYDPATNNYTGGYSATNNATWQKLVVTLSAIDADGNAITGATKTAAGVLFNGDPANGIRGVREVNWRVNIADPHYTSVAVHTTVGKWDGWADADVQDAVTVVIQEFLSPANFGQPSFGEDRGWEPLLAVTLDDLRTAIRSVESVKGISALTLGLNGGTLAAADYTLPKTDAEPIPLPRPGADIVVTVV
jgi:hypothetical protein